MQKGSIGVFDSGFGGLSILSGIVAALPEYDYIYLGDSARAPYGGRSGALVHQFSLQAVEFLFRQGCQLIILACNTASSEALARIQQEYLPRHFPERRVLGVLIPACEAAVQHQGPVGVLATEGTVASGSFPAELSKIKSDIQIEQQAAPLLVPLIEAGEHQTQAASLILERYLEPLRQKQIKTLILGCTHYGLIETQIAQALPDVKLINEARVVPQKLADYFQRHPELETRLMRSGKQRFYTSELSARFKRLGSEYFGRQIQPRLANLEPLP
jgi:glutamate racemase